VAVSCGGYLSAAVTADGKVVCWGGYNAQQKCIPLDLDNVIAVSCGGGHTAAVTHDNKVFCWGDQKNCNIPDNVVARGSVTILL
jgi:alpha-tubulin suppressor-like RCC1 family protein